MTPTLDAPTTSPATIEPARGISRRAALRRAGAGGAAVAGAALLGREVSAAARQTTETDREAFLAISDGIIAALNAGDPDALDAWVAPDAIGHVPLTSAGEGKDLSWVKDRLALSGTAFPERKISVKGIIIDGDQISAHGVFEGTHDGPLLDLSPTGGKIVVAWIAFVTVKAGKVSEYWYQIDALGALEQFGLFAIDGEAASAGKDDEEESDY